MKAMIRLVVTSVIVLLVASPANAAPVSKLTESSFQKKIRYLSARVMKDMAILRDIYDDLTTIGKRTKDFERNMAALSVNVTSLGEFYHNFQPTPPQKPTSATGNAGNVALGDIRDCTDVLASGHTRSGVYSVTLASLESPTQLYCRMEGGQAWNIIQRRADSSVDFNRNWEDYKNGFGDLEGSFWLGNDNIHLLTNQGRYRLQVRLERFNGQSARADYNFFRIKDEENRYQLLLGDFTGGGGGDCLYYHDFQYFSTSDQDNDEISYGSCAVFLRAGWWFKDCGQCNPNGVYHNSAIRASGAATWNPWTYYMESLRLIEFGLLRVSMA
ncbi:PREDICTED: ficolin-2-like [Branchiostoma belcheri]|uniref:Ficolin-2-like n=1 Tax=Branchiostoma belcheri TaxID=7741 RepID=A0A6P4XWW1_BRABE|nr:PREDICTED: ficolin-2-like [Branchiostoma belcheri]